MKSIDFKVDHFLLFLYFQQTKTTRSNTLQGKKKPPKPPKTTSPEGLARKTNKTPHNWDRHPKVTPQRRGAKNKHTRNKAGKEQEECNQQARKHYILMWRKLTSTSSKKPSCALKERFTCWDFFGSNALCFATPLANDALPSHAHDWSRS